MAHEIESMFFVGETPWHGLGTRLGETPTVADAIKEAGLDWKVKTVPLFTATGQEVPARATMRETDSRVLGVVGTHYTVLQNEKAFDFFNPFVESGLVSLETAGSLRDGERIWVLARINEGGSDTEIVKGDAVRKFLMLSNSHDGTTAVRVGFTPVRIVCANTLAAAHVDGSSALIRLRHGRSVATNLDSLRETINIANRTFEATAEQFRALATKQINAKDLNAYVKRVLGHGATDDKDLSTRAQNQIADVVTLFAHGRGDAMPGVAGTLWAAYNAVTEYLTHAAGADADKRYSSLWFGANAKRNSDALSEALALLAA
jgi:phage/plasmid-like protein (TIGR03299 family)